MAPFKEERGGVTKGDIDLLFEDADNELRSVISLAAKLKFDLTKMLTKFTNMVEQYEYHVSGQVSDTDGPLFSLGQSDDPGRGSGASELQPKQEFVNDRPRSPLAARAIQKAAPKVKKEKEGQ